RQIPRVEPWKKQAITGGRVDFGRPRGGAGGGGRGGGNGVLPRRRRRAFCRTRGAVTLKGRTVGSQCCGPQGRSLVLDRESNGSREAMQIDDERRRRYTRLVE